MDLREREVAEDKAQPVSHFLLDRLHDRMRRAAIGAFVIAVLDQRHRRIGRAVLMIVVANRPGEPAHILV